MRLAAQEATSYSLLTVMVPHAAGERQADLGVHIAVGDGDSKDIDDATARLRRELLELEVERVERVPAGEPPSGARAFEVFALGSLAVTLVRNVDTLSAVVRAVRAWLARDQRRAVRLELDGDTLEVTGVSSEQQERLISAWLARNADLRG
jgi:hypothetical protein